MNWNINFINFVLDMLVERYDVANGAPEPPEDMTKEDMGDE